MTDSASHYDQLGRLQPVDIRTVWLHEARDFTPWLLENADVLGEALGMNLVLSAAEHRVGGYALDLIGEDEATGDVVIVENQLEPSDHSHLGQILTYAGGTDPVNVVWIATVFREEHRAALEWLNERTNERTRFFAIQVSSVRIGDSVPAPLLSLVVRPNDWGKQVRAAAASDTTPTFRSGLYRQFWASFLDRVRMEFPAWTNARVATSANWMNLPSGIGGLLYGVSFGRQGLSSELYFGDAAAEVNELRFAAAERHKVEVEAAYGQPLSWEPLPGKKASRVAHYRPGNIDDRDGWDEYIGWLIDSQSRLRRAFDAIGGVGTLSNAVRTARRD